MARFIKEGLPPEHITMTSDGLGSLPHFNEKGELEKLEMGYPDSLLTEIAAAVRLSKNPKKP